ncbi:MAG: hypothetical protein WCI51_06790 [Lentisphaerota bacterium]
MLYQCDKFIIGASFAGIGIACKYPDSVVIEPSICVGGEFINAVNPGTGWDGKLHSKDAIAFLNRIKEHNAFESGKIHLTALSPIFCDWIVNKKITLKMATEIKYVKPSGSGFEITTFDADGEHKLYARQIIDTTEGICSAGLSGSKPPVLGKRLNALLHSDHGEIRSGAYGDIEIREGRFRSESVAMFKLPPDCGWPEARRILHAAWTARHQALREWKIAAVAIRFDYKIAAGLCRIKKNWLHMPSCGYQNPVTAYDNGCSVDLQEEK